MRLDWLADALRAEGCEVEEHTGWKTRTLRPFDGYTPFGVIDHHTAGSSVLTDYPGPPYYRNTALETKCNLTIRGDGVVVTLNAGWAADSGYGDRNVLHAVTNDLAAPRPSDTYSDLDPVIPGGPNPGISGNAYFIDIEVQHLGNGTPIAPAQRDALIRANAAICRHLRWDPLTRVIGHREWTTRKVDPRWDGAASPMPEIRRDTRALIDAFEEVDMPLSNEDLQKIADAVWFRKMPHPSGVERGAQALLVDTAQWSKASADKQLNLTAEQIAAIADHISTEVADSVADELAGRLQA